MPPDQVRRLRKFRNVSRKRPETTNLNHQTIFRRVVMDRIPD
jgi:hypothetical protein